MRDAFSPDSLLSRACSKTELLSSFGFSKRATRTELTNLKTSNLMSLLLLHSLFKNLAKFETPQMKMSA